MRFISRLWLAAVAAVAMSDSAHAQYFTEFEIAQHVSFPNRITAGPDGALWYTQYYGQVTIGRITTTGQITNFSPSQTSGQLSSITSGPDGALWFVDQGGGQIGRITTSGSATLYPVGSYNIGLGTIAPGPDGALWFTEAGTAPASGQPIPPPGQIGRITTSGAITTFQIPSGPYAAPVGIVSGPQGALWFTEFGCSTCSPVVPGKIGRITTAGTVTEFALPANRWPGTIVAGSDGALWFLELNMSSGTAQFDLGRMTTSGAVSEFALNLTPAYLGQHPQFGGLTSGHDGALWYLGASGTPTVGSLGRVTTSGVETDYAIPNNGVGGGVVTGPDGAMWFTGLGTDSIGRFGSTPSSLLATSILPSSRSVTLSETATAFATVINGGTTQANNCSIVPNLTITPFSYQTTNPLTNVPTGSPNTPVSIGPGAAQSFVISFGPMTGSFVGFGPEIVPFEFSCDSGAAIIIPGVNTLTLSASTTPTADVIALAATTTNDGILHIAGTSGTAAFATATVNLGSGGPITVSANTGSGSIPVSLSICQTDPVTAACLSPPSPSVTATINTNATPTFSIFAAATGSIPFAPGTSRIFVQFSDSGAVVRGSTSVAVETQ